MGVLNQDRIYCLLKDPHWTFIWWELSSQTCDELFTPPAGGENVPPADGGEPGGFERTPRPQPALLLRVHDITDIIFDGRNSHHVFDLGEVEARGEWYLHIPLSNRVYCAELGVRAEDGGFRPVVVSRPLYVPRDRPSDSLDERWGTIEICAPES